MSLDLDERQRAMLQEMGVRVWLPTVVAPESPVIAIENIAVDAITTGAAALKISEVRLPERAVTRPTQLAAPATPAVLAALAEGIANMDWPALAQTVATCQACKLCTGRRASVFGGTEAPGPADWLLVGEPPDEAEERLGAPFADQAGLLLDNMLKAVGVSRRGADGGGAAKAYVTNVVKCRPAAVRNPEPQELAVCETYLQREVALVQPKVILALGRFAAQTLLKGSLSEGASIPLGKLRGQIYRYQGIPVVVTYHPTYLLRTPQDKARAWADWCLALDAMQRGK